MYKKYSILFIVLHVSLYADDKIIIYNKNPVPHIVLEEYEHGLLNSKFVKDNPYRDQKASVRVGVDVSIGEQECLNARKPKIKAALEKFLGKQLNGKFVPTIALINSGGGARAFICCLGWHLGSEATGFLDTITYDIGLSGGSWFVTSWLSSGKLPSAFKDIMQPIMNKNLYDLDHVDAKHMLDAVAVRDALNQDITLVNAWGALLANTYLSFQGDQAESILFSTQTDMIKRGDWPFPIITAADGYSKDYGSNKPLMNWFEFTPYEVSGVGNWLGNSHVPTWGFGRKYKDGDSIDYNPEYDVGLLMGMCGSAFALSYARDYEEIMHAACAEIPLFSGLAEKITNIFVNKMIPDAVQNSATENRFTFGAAPNFALGLTDTIQELRFVDAGIAFNLPVPPALTRNVDVLVLLDASAGELGSELQLSADYARLHGYKFPSISLENIQKNVITIFAEENDPTVPIVIYMPRIDPTGKVNTDFPTTKFNYSNDEYLALSGVTEANMKNAVPEIKQILTELIQSHKGFKE